MNEIEKLYKNVGIEEPIARLKIFKDDNGKIYTQPPFTAEKQIELIKWLANYERFCCWKFKPTNQWVIYDSTYLVDGRDIANSNFEECLASWVISIWDDLTEAEQNEIKNILKG